MTIKNTGQINKAKYYIDERNQWCEDCKDRLSDDDDWDDILLTEAAAPNTDCTECIAFAAGVHPDQRTGASREDTGDFKNSERADRALKVLEFYQTECLGEVFEGNSQEISSLIADLLHLTRRVDQGDEPIWSTLRLAQRHFEAEEDGEAK